MSVATATTGTASLGLIRLPAGGPFAMNIAVPAHNSFNLTGKHISVSFKKKCSGSSPVLFETNSEDGDGHIAVYNGGTPTQSVAILISPDAVSLHDDNAVFSRRVSVEGLTVEVSIDIRTSPSADLSWRLQGDILWQNKHGDFTE
jgi:hypothetical protein